MAFLPVWRLFLSAFVCVLWLNRVECQKSKISTVNKVSIVEHGLTMYWFNFHKDLKRFLGEEAEKILLNFRMAPRYITY